jgi:hypothetical protein
MSERGPDIKTLTTLAKLAEPPQQPYRPPNFAHCNFFNANLVSEAGFARSQSINPNQKLTSRTPPLLLVGKLLECANVEVGEPMHAYLTDQDATWRNHAGAANPNVPLLPHNALYRFHSAALLDFLETRYNMMFYHNWQAADALGGFVVASAAVTLRQMA